MDYDLISKRSTLVLGVRKVRVTWEMLDTL